MSPFGFLEELFTKDPWRLLLSAILLNRTRRCKVDLVLYQLLRQWPTADAMTAASPEALSKILCPLGMHRERAETLVRFSKDYRKLLENKCNHFCWTENDVLNLYGCGSYSLDTYRIFIQGELIRSDDDALNDYVDYQRAARTTSKKRRKQLYF
mmetsp:Transcript_10300/g.23819  ORF Transcript_10300/g.23819 Transcript_10300/m.23819 type:complete len:154 (+) Transcript_10300:98-559(+)